MLSTLLSWVNWFGSESSSEDQTAISDCKAPKEDEIKVKNEKPKIVKQEQPITRSKKKIVSIRQHPVTRGKKRQRVVITPSPKKKIGLANYSPPILFDDDSMESKIVIDSGLPGIDAALASRAEVHPDLHANLVLLNPTNKVDHYYILQVITDKKRTVSKCKKNKKNNSSDFFLFTRWGRTGTAGQAKLDGPHDSFDVVANKFKDNFGSKCGLEWSKITTETPPVPGKYEYLRKKIPLMKAGKWFYFVSIGPNGQIDEWHPFDDNSNQLCEQLYSEFLSSICSNDKSTRFIHNESCSPIYKVDLLNYIQTDVKTGQRCPIMRCTDGRSPGTISSSLLGA